MVLVKNNNNHQSNVTATDGGAGNAGDQRRCQLYFSSLPVFSFRILRVKNSDSDQWDRNCSTRKTLPAGNYFPLSLGRDWLLYSLTGNRILQNLWDNSTVTSYFLFPFSAGKLMFTLGHVVVSFNR